MKVRSLPRTRNGLSYEGRQDGLKASDARLEFEVGRLFWFLLVRFFFMCTNVLPNTTRKNWEQNDNINCLHECCDAAVITKKCSNREIFITKVYIHVNFSTFTKILITKIWSYTVSMTVTGELFGFCH